MIPAFVKNTKYVYFALFFIAGFIGINLALISSFDFYWFLVIPLIIAIVYLAFVKPPWLIILVAFLTPLSVVIKIEAVSSTFQLPNELIIWGLMLLFFINLMLNWKYDPAVLKHPLTIVILINLGWILITSISSTIPIVSIKFFLSRLWFVTIFYFLVCEIYKNFSYYKSFIWAFSASLIIVIIYTVSKHAGYGFEQEFSNLMTKPFFNDHTVYAATISLVLPTMIAFVIAGKVFGFGMTIRIIALLICLVFITGIIFSYSRASWIGLAVAFASFIMFRFFRIKFSHIFVTVLLLSGLFFTFQHTIFDYLKRNQEVSDTDYAQHIRSMYNVTTDISNTERINRWMSAFRMFNEKPFLGWGPGTYTFQYAPFQLSDQMTPISTNLGEGGNAHSEYFGPLAESGILGLLSFLAIIITSLYIALKLYYNGKTAWIRVTVLCALLGLITYFTHGFLNNFLDTDKASVPFWSLIAILTVLDLKNRKLK